MSARRAFALSWTLVLSIGAVTNPANSIPLALFAAALLYWAIVK